MDNVRCPWELETNFHRQVWLERRSRRLVLHDIMPCAGGTAKLLVRPHGKSPSVRSSAYCLCPMRSLTCPYSIYSPRAAPNIRRERNLHVVRPSWNMVSTRCTIPRESHRCIAELAPTTAIIGTRCRLPDARPPSHLFHWLEPHDEPSF